MYTVCPSCARQFRIHARQLRAAQGLVQCGFCGRQYNALQSLYDRPVSARSLQPAAPAREEQAWFDIPAGAGPTASGEVADTQEPAADRDDELIADLLEDEPARASGRRGLWAAGSVFLLLLALVQVLWFNRDTLYDHYPRLVPVVGRICEELHCSIFRRNGEAEIALLNRDVREHPRFLHSLLINATIENRSLRTVSYPDIQLILYDTSGRITGYRRFSPNEYVADSMDIRRGLPPRAPMHVVLEVSGADEKAVSFEFRFAAAAEP